MSLTSSLQRIVSAKEDIRQAIINKGVNVGSDAKLSTYADYIDDIVTGGGGSGLTQEKTVTLNLEGGDQIVLPDQDYTLSKVTITKPSSLVSSNIKYGITIAGVEGSLNVGAQPTLNAPTISRSNNTVTISNPSTNGNFNSTFKLYNSGTKFGEQTGTSVDLQKVVSTTYVMTCKCSNGEAGFIDSAASNSLEFTVFEFLDKSTNVDTSFDWKNECNGIELSFTITPKTGYYLPPKIDIFCNGKKLDYSYNPYTGAVTIDALSQSYAGTLSDMGKLGTPAINGITKQKADITTPAGCEHLVFNADGTDCTPVNNSEDIGATTVVMGISGVNTPKLVAPHITLKKDDLQVVDSFLMDGDVLYSEDYSLSVDGTVVANDIDATQDQHTLISYTNIRNFNLTNGYYKSTNTGSNTWALLRVDIIAPAATSVKVSYTAYTRSSYCYAYLGKLDTDMSDNSNTESNYQVAYTTSATNTSNYTLTVPAGVHYIYFKYRRGSTTSYSDRYLQVKVEEVTA